MYTPFINIMPQIVSTGELRKRVISPLFIIGYIKNSASLQADSAREYAVQCK